MDAKTVLENNYEHKNNSFLYYLHEKSMFDKDAFRQLYEAIRTAAEDEVEISRTAQQIAFIYGQFLKFMLYHFNSEDPYRVTNLPENYNKLIEYLENSVEYYFTTRI